MADESVLLQDVRAKSEMMRAAFRGETTLSGADKTSIEYTLRIVAHYLAQRESETALTDVERKVLLDAIRALNLNEDTAGALLSRTSAGQTLGDEGLVQLARKLEGEFKDDRVYLVLLSGQGSEWALVFTDVKAWAWLQDSDVAPPDWLVHAQLAQWKKHEDTCESPPQTMGCARKYLMFEKSTRSWSNDRMLALLNGVEDHVMFFDCVEDGVAHINGRLVAGLLSGVIY
jgi:hypothetical protein